MPDSNLSDNSNYESNNLSNSSITKRVKLERVYTSDSELYNNSSTTGKINSNATSDSNLTSVSPQPRNDWILVLTLFFLSLSFY